MLYVGIDPGTHTGFAVWETRTKRLVSVETLLIHEALSRVKELSEGPEQVRVIIEDARHVSRSGPGSRAREQGAGSIKRDCSIWEDFCDDFKIPCRFQRPGNTKVTPEYFQRLTGWTGRTSNHARDAVMLVFGK